MSLGKSMYQSEHESHGSVPVPARKKAGGRDKGNYKPIRSFQQQDEPSLGALLYQIWVRMRPAWASLRYRWNGLVSRKNLVKVALLAGLGYYIVFADKSRSTFSDTGENEGASIFEREEKATTPKAKKTKYKPENDAAPVAANQLFSVAAKKYIERYAEMARKEQREFGIPASISLAQGLIESRAGTSKLAVGNNNHFGMKCFARNCRKGHCTNHTDDTHKDFFRKFPSAWESWREHSRMLSKGRYAKLKRHGTDYRKWAYGLKSVGYATDRTYAEKLIGVIEKYDLHRFD